jgi:antitoxin HicB
MDYRLDIRKDTNGTYLASFPDLPGVHTFGTTKAEALERATDAFLTGVEFMIRTRRSVPAPKAEGGTRLQVSALVASKIELHNLMLENDVNRAELSRRLHMHRPQVDRLVNLRHGSTLDQLEAAFGALGQRLEISVRKAKVA